MNFKEWIVSILPERKKTFTEGFKFSGISKDPDDDRDYLFMASDEPLPEYINWAAFSPETENQGRASSCTAFAGTSSAEALRNQAGEYYISFSEHDLYYLSRIDAGLFPADGGCYMRNVMKVMKEKGLLPEKLSPYNDADINRKPGIFAATFGGFLRFKIQTYVRLQGHDQIKTALSQGLRVFIGTPIYTSFYNFSGNSIPMPKATEKVIGGHAYYIVGYDDKIGKYLIHNSWGNWSGDGFAWMPYEYLDFVSWYDAWTFTF